MSGTGAAAMLPLPLGAAPAAVSSRLVCCEPEASAMEACPRLRIERDGGVDSVRAPGQLRCAGSAGEQRVEFCAGFAHEFRDPAEIDPGRRRSL